MPIETVPQTDFKYYLVAYDKKGNERDDDPDGLMHERVLDAIEKEPFTDVILMCHGWLQDIPSARSHYTSWLQAMWQCEADRQQIEQTRPGFNPLLVAMHWPSKPWGDEDLGGGPASFSAPGAGAPGTGMSWDDIVEHYADCLGDSPEAATAVRTIVESAMNDLDAQSMPDDVAAAYQVIDRMAKLNSDGGFVAEGVGREPFDPAKSFRNIEHDVVSFSGGGFDWGGLLWPLRQLSFWKMKDRARVIGQLAGYQLLKTLQAATTARIHLTGHSFGCVTMAAAVAGPDEPNDLLRPVDSLTLLQGTMSLWACSAARPGVGGAGYFHSVIADHRVAGPIVVSYSENDTALVRVYPMAAGIAGQVSFGPAKLPKYGAAGAYGLRGPGLTIVDSQMVDARQNWRLEPGKINNVDASQFIRRGWGLTGAHNNIAVPEVAHLHWSTLS